MYLAHYGLNKKPFDISPDPAFLWLSEKHKEALAHLKYGIHDDKGFLVITGEVGTGKTALIKYLVKLINIGAIVVTVPDPDMSRIDFYNYLASELNMRKEFKSKGDFLIHFKKFLLNAFSSYKKVLLIIDEAQRLNNDLLDEIRLLGNIDLNGLILLNIFFIGQNEFKAILMDDANKSIRQRITASYQIDSLLVEEVWGYIRHRLQVAGSHQEIFTPEAIGGIYKHSKGYPRLINIICDHALMTGYADGLKIIDIDTIEECADDLKIAIGGYQSESGGDEISPIPGPMDEITKPLEQAIHENQDDYLRVAVGNKIPKNQDTYIKRAIGEDVFETPEDDQIMTALKTYLEKNPVSIKEKEPDLPAADHQKRAVGITAVIIAFFLFAIGGYLFQEPLFRVYSQVEVFTAGLLGRQAEESTLRLDHNTATALSPAEHLQIAQKKIDSVLSAEERLQVTQESNHAAASSETAVSSEEGNDHGYDESQDRTETAAAEVENLRADVKKEPPPALVRPTLENQKFIVFFEHNSNNLPAQTLEVLNRIIDLVMNLSFSDIIIKGYTDSLGNVLYNKKLSADRANRIKSYLIERGVPESKIRTYGMGPDNPIASNATREGRSKNRRVEIELSVGHHEELDHLTARLNINPGS